MRSRTLPRIKTYAAIAAGIFRLASFAAAQTPAPIASPPPISTPAQAPWQFASPSPSSADTGEPPHEIPIVEKAWDDLSNKEVGEMGRIALGIKPEKWKHAETDNFVIHYRRVTEARKVAREIEYDLWFVAKSLGAIPAQYRHKSHVFIFEDENEWYTFVKQTPWPLWMSSCAVHDELFLNIRITKGNEEFDSRTLAHETTHAVVARLYPFEHWPIWLNEGFAEYMAGASMSARSHQQITANQQKLEYADMPLDDLFALKAYPQERDKVDQLYETGEKLVRFLMNELPKDRFRKFVTDVLATNDPKQSLITIYGDKFKDYAAFEKKFKAFSK